MKNIAQRDTGVAKLPGLPAVNAQDPALRNWINAVSERLEVREGSRGNPWERAVTIREIKDTLEVIDKLKEPKKSDDRSVSIDLGGGLSASVAIDRFVESIKATRLYRDLMKRLDDPTRFDDVVKDVRDILLRSIADEAAKRGADIRRMETVIQDANRSLAYTVEEITAALGANAAGVREVTFAFADASQAQAGKITQLEASLGNYYADGTSGRVALEQQLGVFGDRVDGLRGQYTVKIQAGNKLAGFGLAADEDPQGRGNSAFIISADKFAVVLPSYTVPTVTVPLRDKAGAQVTNPDGSMATQEVINASAISPSAGGIPFGVDAHGIYLNNNVYVRGAMIVDTPGGRKPLGSGLRGSVDVQAGGSSWSDAAAISAVWAAIGRPDSGASYSTLVIGDRATIGTGASAVTKYWDGSKFTSAGVVINGNLLVDGTVAAGKINTRGLSIRDEYGNVVFSAGAGLSVQQRIAGLGALATQNSVDYNAVTGHKPPSNATAGGEIGVNVRFPDGTIMLVTDFVSRLSRIKPGNISTFMETAAIGNAYIGNAAISTAKIQTAAVETLSIAGNAVTVPKVDTRPGVLAGSGAYVEVASVTVTLAQPGWVYAMFTAQQSYGYGIRASTTSLNAPDGSAIAVGGAAVTTNIAVSHAVYRPAGPQTFKVTWIGENAGVSISNRTLFVMGVMR